MKSFKFIDKIDDRHFFVANARSGGGKFHTMFQHLICAIYYKLEIKWFWTEQTIYELVECGMDLINNHISITITVQHNRLLARTVENFDNDDKDTQFDDIKSNSQY